MVPACSPQGLAPSGGLPAEPALPAIASRPIRVPTVKEGDLLMSIGAVATYLGEEIHGTKHTVVGLVTRVNRG